MALKPETMLGCISRGKKVADGIKVLITGQEIGRLSWNVQVSPMYHKNP
jgi:hypothetical protein